MNTKRAAHTQKGYNDYKVNRVLVVCNFWRWSTCCQISLYFMCVWDESTWVVHSTFILCGAALCFLKETEGTNDPFAVAQTCTICACPVTLSSSSNIQTSVQFKLAGHGPVTYFPHNMLCNIRGEAVCHQLTNLHHRIVWAERRGNPDTALLKQRVHGYVSEKEMPIRPLSQLTPKGETQCWKLITEVVKGNFTR